MSKKEKTIIAAAAAIVCLAAFFLLWKHYAADTSESGTVMDTRAVSGKPNFPEIGFQPALKDTDTPLAQIPNYQATAAKYGFKLSAAQEKYLETNRFLLLDPSQVPFLNSTSTPYNFDQWLTDSDRFGGGSIFDRKPEDSVLVTPDTVLHAYHRYFELTLEQLEENELSQSLESFLGGLQANLADAVKSSQGQAQVRYQNLYAQISVARAVFDAKNAAKPDYFPTPADEQGYNDKDQTADNVAAADALFDSYASSSLLTPELVTAAKNELALIYAGNTAAVSPLYGQYDDRIQTDYTQFTPRSHYTKNSTLRAYFRTMIYLGRNSYLAGSDLGIADANLLAKQMARKTSGAAPLDSWRRIKAVTDFYAGQSDDLSYDEWQQFVAKTINTYDDNTLVSAASIDKMRSSLDQLRQPKILSGIVIDPSIASKTKDDLLKESIGFRIMGQKFTYDAWILNDLTAAQEKTEVKLPSMPSALFVAAASGNRTAKAASNQFLKQSAGFSSSQVSAFDQKLDAKTAAISKISQDDWISSLGSAWLYVLGSLSYDYGSGYPLYMQASSFQNKQIQTFLGSYTELKHDTLLYAKQSYAEMGAGGEDRPIPPVVKGFVEPNLVFWNRLMTLLDRNRQLFASENLFANNDARNRLESFQDTVSLYAKVAKQELEGETVSDADYETIRTADLSYMAQPFETIDPTPTSGQTALIADIHTDSETQKILYEGTAKPYLMLVLIGNEDSPRVAVGLSYNHYEFTDALGQRHDDEWWRNQVYGTSTLPAKNFWYSPLNAD